MKSSKRNPAIESVRLMACLIVVACHVNFYLNFGEDHEIWRTFFFCLFSDGVSIFFLISGCFLFANKSLSLLWKRTLKKILLPVVFLFLLCLALSSFRLPVKYFDHTWYVFVYTAVILLYPLLKRFSAFLDRGNYRGPAFLVLSLVFMVLNDLAENRLFFFGFSPLSGLLPACIMILWGHLLCRRLLPSHDAHVLPRGVFVFTGAFLFVLINLIRTYAQLALYASGSEYNLRVWHTSFGLLAASSILFPTLFPGTGHTKTVFPPGGRKINLPTAVCALASYTFGIYLIHPLLSALALHFDLWNQLQDFFFRYLSCVPGAVCFLLTGTLALFLVSLLLCFLLRSALCALKSVRTRFPDET